MDKTTPPTITYPVAEPPEPGAFLTLGPGLHWLRLPLPLALNHINCYVIEDDDGLTIVDTGFDSRKMRALWADTLRSHFPGRDLRRVLVTHHHPDHIGLAGWFQTEYGAELITTRTAWLMARMLHLDEQDRPSPETMAFWRAAGMAPDILEQRSRERPFNFVDAVAPLPLGYKRIRAGDLITLAGQNWVMREGNGHAPEHATLWSTDGNWVIGGDQFLPTISPNLGVYATEPAADPVGEWLASCRAFLDHAQNRSLVLPGHGLPFRGLGLRLGQLIENHESALRRLIAFLETPRTTVDCFEVLFKRKIGASDYGLALVEAVAHVNHLYLGGRVTRSPGPNGAWLWQRKDDDG